MIDLHVHSLISDGSYMPAALARLAKQRGLQAFALTDHESIAGDAEAAAEAERLGIDFLPGMEMTVDYQERRLHIVCLGFSAEQEEFQKLYRKIRSIKEARMDELIAGIAAKGVTISRELVKEHAIGNILDRYAVMRYLVSLRLYDHAQPLWDNYINPVVEALGLDYNVTAEEALPAIRAAGGVTSLAHFHKKLGLGNLSREEQEQAIVELHALGLDGMDRFYPSYTEEDAAFAERMIRKYDLLPTGGTDFHGTNRPGIELGTGWQGNIHVPYQYYENIAAKKRQVLEKTCCKL